MQILQIDQATERAQPIILIAPEQREATLIAEAILTSRGVVGDLTSLVIVVNIKDHSGMSDLFY